uniref:18 kDa Sin3-associated polypeptide n=1 Tax=Caenorhabditis tropicalis TaxID=1561998 RepID=A0A1I7TT51_9PELO
MSHNGQQLGSQVVVGQDKPIDREKVCPLLLRVFCSNNRHNPISEFNNRNGGTVPPNELQMFTWVDCTLSELAMLIKEINPDARRKGTTFDFAIVQPDRMSQRFNLREIGNTMNGQRGIDDNKTLQQCKFEVGDFIDVAISIPGSGRRFGGHREPIGDRFERRNRSPIRGRSPI